MKKFDICYHAKIMLRGLVRVIWGSVNAGLIGMATYGFVLIPTEGGYAAVCDFIGAICVMVLAIGSSYTLGVGSFKKAKSK